MQTPPTPPAAPQPTAVIVGEGANQITIPVAPRTVRELEGLRAQRSELSTQLNSSVSRRSRLVAEINRTQAGPERAGLEQRMTVLDKRIVQLESDIAETGRQLSTPEAGMLAATAQQTPFFGLSRSNVTAISIIFTIFVLAPLALAAARNLWKRGNRPIIMPDAENARKIEQLQQSIDTIAVEVERVSEGQRFVTKLLSEQHRVPAIGAGQETVLREAESVQR